MLYPFVVCSPCQRDTPCFIYLYPEGMITDAAPGGKIEQLVKRGYIVTAVDLIDLPDLMGLIAPRKIAVVDMKDQLKEPASGKMLEKELGFPFSVYSKQNLPGNINIAAAPYDLGSILDWSFK